jgi:putative redox protein
VRAVATIAAPSDTAHVRELFDDELAAIRADGQADVVLAGRTFTITDDLVASLEHPHLEAALDDLQAALLVLHSPDDRTVPIEHATRLYTAARHPKSFVSLAGADHLLTDPDDAEYVGAVLAAWASRYLDAR